MPEDEVCGICRVQFDGTCPTCKYPGDDCTLRELYSLPSPKSGPYPTLKELGNSNRQMCTLLSHGMTLSGRLQERL